MIEPNDLIAKLNDIEQNGIGNWWNAKEIILTIQAILAQRDNAIAERDEAVADQIRIRDALNKIAELCTY
jgi:hypothetical protein